MTKNSDQRILVKGESVRRIKFGNKIFKKNIQKLTPNVSLIESSIQPFDHYLSTEVTPKNIQKIYNTNLKV